MRTTSVHNMWCRMRWCRLVAWYRRVWKELLPADHDALARATRGACHCGVPCSADDATPLAWSAKVKRVFHVFPSSLWRRPGRSFSLLKYNTLLHPPYRLQSATAKRLGKELRGVQGCWASQGLLLNLHVSMMAQYPWRTSRSAFMFCNRYFATK
jgi:hypothetical protein